MIIIEIRSNNSYLLHFADDSLKFHNGRPFSTKDRDNDPDNRNCPVLLHGAWWYNQCYHSNLNGKYYNVAGHNAWNGIGWLYWKNNQNKRLSMKRVLMKIRPNN